MLGLNVFGSDGEEEDGDDTAGVGVEGVVVEVEVGDVVGIDDCSGTVLHATILATIKLVEANKPMRAMQVDKVDSMMRAITGIMTRNGKDAKNVQDNR